MTVEEFLAKLAEVGLSRTAARLKSFADWI
jgi:hypothetical protein